MFKRIMICLLEFLIFCTLMGCFSNVKEESSPSSSTLTPSKVVTNLGEKTDMKNNIRLIVKGKDITSDNFVNLNYECHYAELPLTAVLKALGAKVEWKKQTIAKITINNKDYILDTNRASLVEAGDKINLLVVAPGSNHGVKSQVINNEFVIDSDSVKLFIVNMIGAKIEINYNEKIINIG